MSPLPTWTQSSVLLLLRSASVCPGTVSCNALCLPGLRAAYCCCQGQLQSIQAQCHAIPSAYLDSEQRGGAVKIHHMLPRSQWHALPSACLHLEQHTIATRFCFSLPQSQRHAVLVMFLAVPSSKNCSKSCVGPADHVVAGAKQAWAMYTSSFQHALALHVLTPSHAKRCCYCCCVCNDAAAVVACNGLSLQDG